MSHIPEMSSGMEIMARNTRCCGAGSEISKGIILRSSEYLRGHHTETFTGPTRVEMTADSGARCLFHLQNKKAGLIINPDRGYVPVVVLFFTLNLIPLLAAYPFLKYWTAYQTAATSLIVISTPLISGILSLSLNLRISHSSKTSISSLLKFPVLKGFGLMEKLLRN